MQWPPKATRTSEPPPRRPVPTKYASPYEVLGVPRDASKSEAKKKYRQLVLQNHPDKHPDNSQSALEKLVQINSAAEALLPRHARPVATFTNARTRAPKPQPATRGKATYSPRTFVQPVQGLNNPPDLANVFLQGFVLVLMLFAFVALLAVWCLAIKKVLAEIERVAALVSLGLNPSEPPHFENVSLTMPNPREVLGLNASANQEEVKRAYRKLALRWHPDKNPNNQEEARPKMVEINAAHEQLRRCFLGDFHLRVVASGDETPSSVANNLHQRIRRAGAISEEIV